MAEKYMPKVGEKVTLENWYCATKTPYTVIRVSKSEIVVQECALFFNGLRYFNSVADYISENPNGRTKILHWSPKRGCWMESPVRSWSNRAVFGKWEHEPYVN